MLTAHKIRLDPNKVQATYLSKAAGTARFAYNWALAEWQRQYVARQSNPALPAPSQLALRRQLNAIKRDQYPWMLEVTKCAPQMAIIQLGEAFKNFFAHRARHPAFKRKGQHDRFTISNDQLRIEDQRIQIPKLGWVRMCEKLRFAGRIVSATVSRSADRWYASIRVDTDALSLPPAENQSMVPLLFASCFSYYMVRLASIYPASTWGIAPRHDEICA
jgi:putative transposase